MTKDTKTKNTFFIFIFLVLIISAMIIYLTIYYYMPNYKEVSYFDYYSELSQDEIHFIIDDQVLTESKNPIMKDEELYIPVDFLKEYVDPYIFWESDANKLIITTENKVIRMKTEELNYYVNDVELKLSMPVYSIDNEAYLPASMLSELYNVEIDYIPEYKEAVVNYNYKDKMMGYIKDETPMRYEPSIKSPIAKKISSEDVYIFSEEEYFTKIRTKDGLIGFVKKDTLMNARTIPGVQRDPIKDTPLINEIEGPITLVWDAIYSVEDNQKDSKKNLELGVNVLSPTWFKFDEELLDGTIKNIADKSYVDWAHANNIQVWGLISDIRENTDKNIVSEILTNSDYRETAIKQLLAYVSIYNLDGINVDFESVREDDAAFYLQFLRELNPLLKKQGVSLSVDMYVPTYTKHYNRTEVAKVVDYICVMTYDEYTNSDGESGPVASYDFVERGIGDTLEEVPKEKVLMGIPLYSRIWRNGKRFKELSRDSTITLFNEQNAKFAWQEDLGLYYAQYTITEDGENAHYEVWLEDERALSYKMRVLKSFDVKGVCIWARGLGYDLFYETLDKEFSS